MPAIAKRPRNAGYLKWLTAASDSDHEPFSLSRRNLRLHSMSGPQASSSWVRVGAATTGAQAYLLRVWDDGASPPRLCVMVRPVGSDQWLGFANGADLLAYLAQRHAGVSQAGAGLL